MMLFSVARISPIKRAFKFVFSGFSLFFIGMLVFMVVHDTLTGESLTTTEYCAKYGFLASPDCW
jgi:ABC-type enterochelin transport system permease subunit